MVSDWACNSTEISEISLGIMQRSVSLLSDPPTEIDIIRIIPGTIESHTY